MTAEASATGPVSQPDPDQAPPPPESVPGELLGPESAEPEAVGLAASDALADAEPEPEPVAESVPETVTAVTPKRRTDLYDPLAGWNAGRRGLPS